MDKVNKGLSFSEKRAHQAMRRLNLTAARESIRHIPHCRTDLIERAQSEIERAKNDPQDDGLVVFYAIRGMARPEEPLSPLGEH